MRFLPLLGLALASVASPAFAQLTTPSILSSTDSATQPIYVFDITSGAYNPSTIPFGQKITGLAYDQSNRRAYVLVRNATTATRSDLYSIDLNPVGSPVFIAQVNGASTNITSGGLAWDGPNNRLVATFSGNIYSMDPATATVSILRAVGSSQNFNGADIDPVTGALYLMNNASTSVAPMFGRGVYRIDAPYDTSTPIKIAVPPVKPAGTGAGSIDTDIDGCAAAPGVIYLSTDEANALYRLNLSTLAYDAPITQPYTGTGALVGGATYVGSVADGADVAISIRNDTEVAVPLAGQFPFAVTIRNVGSQPATASSVSLPLPPGTSFVSATGGAFLLGTTVVLNAGDLTPGAGASFSVTLSSAAAFTATANGSTTASDVFAGNNSASVSTSAGAPDLTVTVTPPANCSASLGNPVTFVVNVGNAGSRAVPSTLTFPIPEGSTFVSSTPEGVPGGGFVGIDLGVIPAGTVVPVSINIIPGDGIVFGITATASAAGDSNPADNTASAGTTTGIYSAAPIRALLSTIAANTNSTFTGLGGEALNGAGTLDSTRSANGRYITSHIRVGPSGNFNDLLIKTDVTTGVSSVMGREGTTVLPGGIPAFDTFLTPGVNDAGDFAFGGRDNQTNDAYAVKNVGGVFTEIARELGPIPGHPGLTYGATAGAISTGGFTNTGVAYWIANIAGNPAGQDEGAFTDDGNTIVYTKGLTPANAFGVITDILNTGYYVSADNTRFIFQATTTTGGSKTNAVVGTIAPTGSPDATAIVVQSNTLPGFSSPVSAISSTVMTPEGRWFVRGSNSDGEDWVISGTGNTVSASNIIARTGATGAPLPITPGSTETWDPVLTSTGLQGNAANARGDYVVYGKSLADTRIDQVWVFNGTTVIAREGDPVDANNDGVFNDNMYIRQLNFDDQMVLTNDALYAIVGLRDNTTAATGICGTGTSSAALALIRIPIPQPNTVVCCRGATCAVVAVASCVDPAGLAGVSTPAGAICNVGSFRTPCCYGDYNKVNGLSVQDIFDFLNDWFTGSPYARAGSDGSAAPLTVQNIFDFLNMWFAGC